MEAASEPATRHTNGHRPGHAQNGVATMDAARPAVGAAGSGVGSDGAPAGRDALVSGRGGAGDGAVRKLGREGGGAAVRFSGLVSVCAGRSDRCRGAAETADTAAVDTDRPPLRCAVCGQHFRNPKILPCLHTFCLHCLRRHVPAESLSVSCPSCKCQFILPPTGVAGLQTNLLLAVEPEPCTACAGTGTCPACVAAAAEEDVQQEDEYEDEEEDEEEDDDSAEGDAAAIAWQLYCSNHAGQTLRFFCRDCETAVCASCTDILHAHHSTCRLTETGPEQRQALLRLRQRVSSLMDVQRRRRALLMAAGAQLRQARQQAELDLQAYCHSLVEAINRRKQALTSLLDQIHRNKVDSIDEQVLQLDSFLSELDSCERHMERALDSGSDTEVLLLNKQVTVRVGGQPPEPADPAAELRFEPTDAPQLEAQLASFGSICTGTEVAAAAAATGPPRRRDTVTETDRPCTEQLLLNIPSPHGHGHGHGHTRSHGHDHSYGHGYDHGHSQSHEDGHGDGHSNGLYQVTPSDVSSERSSAEPAPVRRASRPLSRSAASPSVLSTGSRSSRSSQASLPSSRRSSRRSVPPPLPPTDDLVLSIGQKGRARGEFSNPQGVYYAAASDRLLVADSNNQCVQVFSPDGECKLRFGVRGRGPGQMQRPCGVAVTPDGHYVVSDFENRCLSLFDSLGKLVRRIGHGKLQGPKGVTTDRRGNLLVVDNRGSAVMTFSPGGKLLAKFGTRGTGQHQFAGPHYVAVDSQDRVVVTDFHNHSVKVFSADGKHLFSFGGNGEAAGQFNAPTGVTTDRYDNILVADWGNSRIQVFDNTGRYLSTVNTSATPLYGPQGLTMSPEGHVIVADTGNHAIKLYSYHPLAA